MAVTTLLKTRTDYIEGLLHIDNKMREEVPFRLNPIQRYIMDNKSKRNIILKARQLGCSCLFLADMFIEAITRENSICVVVSHETHATQRLLDRVHFYYDTFPDPKPMIGHESASELSFQLLHSTIYIGTARSMTFGRGDRIDKALLSEMAHYEDPQRILIAVEGATRNGELTIESTPNGESLPSGEVNPFYDVWRKAREKRNTYIPFFFPWWFGKEYQLPRGNKEALESDRGELSYDAEELELVNKFNLNEDQIRWRRATLADIGGAFYQEFPEDEVTCFQQSGEPVFDPVILAAMAKECYEGKRHPHGFYIWKDVEPGMKYVIGADTSAGSGKSMSAAAVLDDNWNVCATFQAKIEPTDFATLLKYMGHYFNTATLVVERNFTGYAVLSSLQDYDNIYMQRDFTTGVESNKPGWWTNEFTKQFMITKFKDALEKIKIWDINLVRQIRGYTYIKFRPTAQTKYNDLFMATAIAVAVKEIVGVSKGYIGQVPGGYDNFK